MAGMNTTVVHHPGGVSIGYNDVSLDVSGHSLNSKESDSWHSIESRCASSFE